jgi:hypothetical protein
MSKPRPRTRGQLPRRPGESRPLTVNGVPGRLYGVPTPGEPKAPTEVVALLAQALERAQAQRILAAATAAYAAELNETEYMRLYRLNQL